MTEWAAHGSLEQWIRIARKRVAALSRSSPREEQLLSMELTKTLRWTLEVAIQVLRGLARLHTGLLGDVSGASTDASASGPQTRQRAAVCLGGT